MANEETDRPRGRRMEKPKPPVSHPNRIEITDPDDPRIFEFQGLRDHVMRQIRERPDGDMAGLFVAEGDLVIERAIAGGYQLDSLLIDAKRSKPLPGVVGPEIPVFAAGPEVLQQITGYHLHRGGLAIFRRRAVPTPESVMAGTKTILVIEGVNNPTNMGVILRCAAALGVEGYLIDPTCCDPLYRRSGRVSMGEAFALPYARLDAFPEGLDIVKVNGFTVLALTPSEGAVDIGDLRFDPEEPVAILLGAEGPGLTQGALDRATLRTKIPMSGTVDSINVGSAAAVAFYAVQRARS